VRPRRGEGVLEPDLTPSIRLYTAYALKDRHGAPWNGTLHLVLADGTARDVSTDADGVVRLENIEPGNVDGQLSELDASAWEKG
jgi:hypothetical protein